MTDIAAVKIVNDPQTQCIIYAIVPGERIACYTGENCMLQGLRVTGIAYYTWYITAAPMLPVPLYFQ